MKSAIGERAPPGGLTVYWLSFTRRVPRRVPDSSNRQDRMGSQDGDKRVAIAPPQRFVDRVVFIDRSGPDRRLIVSEEPDPLELCLKIAVDRLARRVAGKADNHRMQILIDLKITQPVASPVSLKEGLMPLIKQFKLGARRSLASQECAALFDNTHGFHHVEHVVQRE